MTVGEPSSQEGHSAAESLLQQYATPAGMFDEMESAPATPRAHWRGLMESLQRLGRHELAARWENGRRIIREHGVTYNVYGDPQGMNRPWGLDLVPMLITAGEWARVEAGLIQRSRLFNLILADIYSGSQRLLRDGFLPPELIYANPGFLRPCRGIAIALHAYMHLYACDLGRSSEGHWWVLADCTQAPSGAGYAWENRTVISRILPEEIRQGNVQRLASFFRQEREMLFNLAPHGRDNPSAVLLTPGPHNETYFEHAYLARHLGFPLVEGADLTVRDRRVFLKTLEGLQPVDVILRRLDDSFCDPLELRGDSFLGVAGLVEATRAGNVTVANALGTGLLESPAFLAFLPGLCRHLLGEELLLPSIATWWCGQGDELRYVIEHLDDLVVKPAFGAPSRQFAPNRPSLVRTKMAGTNRAKLVEAIRARPRDFVAQERMVLSRAPVWVDDHFEARSVVVRAYAAYGGDAFAVLPGGLTRVSKSDDDSDVSMQGGGGSKDTWILANGSTGRTDAIPVLAEMRLAERTLSGVPSRAADNLFWLGRYTERLEQTLRVLRCVLGHISEEAGREGSVELFALAELMTNLDLLPLRSGSDSSSGELQKQVLQLVYKTDLSGSVRDLLGRIRFIASTVRDRFSGDTWRILGRLEVDARTRPGRLPLVNALALIHNLVLDLSAFNGMEMENMTRGSGWRFLDFGRRLERGQSVVNLLRAAVGVRTRPASVLEPVLEIADSVMTYRRRYFAEPRLRGVLELLLRDDSNPRSLVFQVSVLREHASALMVDPKAANPHDEQKRIASLAGALGSADWDHLAAEHGRGRNEPLLDLLGGWSKDFAALSDDLTGRYFSHTVPRVN
jgi:uncharacterized circularly permuted ATP-grasp superfamily protein/uncharacterized alpha-E superfamily protein